MGKSMAAPLAPYRERFDRRLYTASRLAWLYMTGEWPENEIDHINLDRSDDRWLNLREATRAQNSFNTPRRSNNMSGAKGAYWHSQHRKWCAHIKIDGELKHIGLFATIDEAAAAYAAAAKLHRGEFARTE